MKIIELELFRYKRLALNAIEYIKINPENKIQLILGANGSGKSSLIKEMNPLPGVPNQFNKDGYKKVIIHHRNSVYELKSSFTSTGNKFSFIKDDEELNPGGTVTVYKELVKKFFNITQEVIDLLNGIDNFTSMAVAARRNWITKISDVDYTFAINYYNNLKESHRDILGAIKLNQSRLVQETEKLLSPEEEQKLRDKIRDVNEFIRYLLEVRQNQSSDKASITRYIAELEGNITQHSQNLFNCYKDVYASAGSIDTERLDEYILECQVSSGIQVNTIEELKVQIHEKLETIHLFKNSNLQSASEITEKIKSKAEELDTVSLYTDIKFPDVNQAYQVFINVRETVSDIVKNLEPNNGNRYSRETFYACKEKIEETNKKKTAVVNNISRLQSAKKELEHLKEHGETECPSCSFRWFKGFDEKKYQEILNSIQLDEAILVNIDKELETFNSFIEKVKQYFEQYNQYKNLTTVYPILSPVWDYLSSSNVITNDPSSIGSALNRVQSDILTLINLENIKRELAELHKAQESLNLNETKTLTAIEEEITLLEKNLVETQVDLDEMKRSHNLYTTLRSVKENAKVLKDKVEGLLVTREAKYKELIEINRRDAINSIIMDLQLSNTKDEQIISKVDVQKALVQNIEAQLKELNDKSEVYKILIKELSPTEGLIAKSMTGFINHFVYQINSFIKKIWSYPLELVPMDNSSEDEIDLDFKFGVKVNGDIPIPDIANCSSAMKEVINLAFRIVSMKYLHLEDAPLYLDEFSSAMDHHHRQMAFHVITNLLTSANFSQIFLISHYADSYGSLKNSDVTVLSPMNIVIPKDMAFNKVTVIK